MDNRFFLSRSVLIEGNEMWLLTEDTDIVLQMDFRSMSLKSCYVLPEPETKRFGHMKIIKSGARVFILPYNSQKCYTILPGNTSNNMVIPYENKYFENGEKYTVAATYRGCLFMLGTSMKNAVFIDTYTDELIADTGYLKLIEKTDLDPNRISACDRFCQFGERVYVPLNESRYIIEFNLLDHSYDLYTVEIEHDIRIHTIFGYVESGEEKMLITTCDDETMVWSRTSGVENYRKLNQLKGTELYYHGAFCVNGANYYIAAWERKVFVERGSNITQLDFDYVDNSEFPELNYTQFELTFIFDNYIFFQARSDGQLFCIDTSDNTINKVYFNVSKDERNSVVEEIYSRRRIPTLIRESDEFDLQTFLNVLKTDRG